MKLIEIQEYGTGNPHDGNSYPGPGIYEVGDELFLTYRSLAPEGALIVVGLSSAKGLVRNLLDVVKVQELIHDNATLRERSQATVDDHAATAVVDVHRLLDQIKSIVGAARQ
jgi:hypothetical protein